MEGMEFHFAERVEDVLELVLTSPPPAPRKQEGGKVRRPTARPGRTGPPAS